MSDQVNYYEVLGVPREASQTEIRVAYRRLAKERHPDHPSGSADEFSLLQEAHAVLSDPNRRRTHDEALDLAHAADQLAGLDFGSMEDELAARRQGRESGGPTMGERLRGRFQRKDKAPGGDRSREDVRRRGRYEVREARWFEPQNFDPEPITWRTGAISFVAAFLADTLAGDVGHHVIAIAGDPHGCGAGEFPFQAQRIIDAGLPAKRDENKVVAEVDHLNGIRIRGWQ